MFYKIKYIFLILCLALLCTACNSNGTKQRLSDSRIESIVNNIAVLRYNGVYFEQDDCTDEILGEKILSNNVILANIWCVSPEENKYVCSYDLSYVNADFKIDKPERVTFYYDFDKNRISNILVFDYKQQGDGTENEDYQG